MDGQDPNSGAASYSQSFLQNPYYFMFASLAKPDDDAELHWLKVCIQTVAMCKRASLSSLHFPQTSRMVVLDALRVLSCPLSITLKTQNTTTRTLASSFFPTFLCGQKAAIGSSLVYSKSSGELIRSNR
jgi:hypothetical protein